MPKERFDATRCVPTLICTGPVWGAACNIETGSTFYAEKRPVGITEETAGDRPEFLPPNEENWAKSAGYPRLDKPVRRLPYPEKRAAFAECLRPYPRCRESSAGFAASLLRFCFARSFKIILSLFRKRFALLSEYESRPISVPRLSLFWLYPNYAFRHIVAKTAVMLHKQHRCL